MRARIFNKKKSQPGRSWEDKSDATESEHKVNKQYHIVDGKEKNVENLTEIG